MNRTAAVIWHASFSIAAGFLYFFFVLPRWPELLGDTPHTLGTVLRIVAGALIGLAALPVVFTLLRTRRPEFGTPRLALTLRTCSIALHVLAGVLIIGAAISEIWLSLDDAGQWLFGIYGAAAAIALLGMLAFYLAYVAELRPPPPKPLKPKKQQQRRGRRKEAAEADDDVAEAEPEAEDDVAEAEAEAEEAAKTDDETTSEEAEEDKPAEVTSEADESEVTAEEGKPAKVTSNADESEVNAEAEVTADAEEPETQAEETTAAAPDEPAAEDVTAEAESTNGKLRNRRPSGKTEPTSRRRRRLRQGVAVED